MVIVIAVVVSGVVYLKLKLCLFVFLALFSSEVHDYFFLLIVCLDK